MNICIIWVQWLDNNAFDITDARYNHEDYQKLRLTSFYTTCDPINTTGISHLEILNKNSSKTAPKFRHSLPILLQRNFFFVNTRVEKVQKPLSGLPICPQALPVMFFM